MKNLCKKLLACCLAVCMVLTLCVGALTVSAAATGSVVVSTANAELTTESGSAVVDVTVQGVVIDDVGGIAAARIYLNTAGLAISQLELVSEDNKAQISYADETGELVLLEFNKEGATEEDGIDPENPTPYVSNVAPKVENGVLTYLVYTEAGHVMTTAVTLKITFAIPAEAAEYAISLASAEACYNDKADGLLDIDKTNASCTLTVEAAEAPHEHTPAEAVQENVVAATCTTPGSYDEVVYCSECGEEISRTPKTVDALGHTNGTPVIENEVAATCTVDGSYDTVVYCTVCKEEVSRTPGVYTAAGHKEAEAVIENEVAADCENAGSYDTVVYCTVCKEEISRKTTTIDALGHKFADGTCGVCGAEDPDYVAPVTDSITVELYDANDYNYANVLISKGYEDLKTALEDACDYANGYIVENTFYNPVVILNEDVTLTSDVFVPEYTILDLGDNEIATNDYNVYMAGPYTEIRADYEVVMLKNNPFIGQKESAGVYHYTQKTTYSVSTANLTLGDQIFINFFATPESGSTTPSGATYHVAYYKETNADILYDVEAEGTASSFSIKTIGIPAKEMTDNYIARAYLEKVVDGVTYRVYTPEIKYSVLVYAKAQLSKDDPKWVALVKAMLNYGASAQLHFGHKTESLANAILDEADRELPADFEAEYSTKYLVKSKPVDDDLYTTLMTNGKLSTGYCNGEQNLTLLDGIEYNVFTTDCSSKNTYKLCIWSYDEYRAFVDAANGDLNALSEAMSIENCNNVVEVTDINKIKMPAIAVKNIADTMIYRLVEITPAGETYVDCIASGSPLTYANAVINSDKQSDSMKELCKRLAVYSACARAKFENQIK